MAHNRSNLPGGEILKFLDEVVKREFDSNQRVLSFGEFVEILGKNEQTHLRGSAKYMIDMMDFFGKTPLKTEGIAANAPQRFNVFDFEVDGISHKVVGQEEVQNQLYSAVKTFVRQGINNKLLLLHGPNGSAKSSLIHSIMAGMERYSHEPEGALYTFNWVFPVERYSRGGIGMGTPRSTAKPIESFARLTDDEVLARIPCDLCDHPLLIIPVEQRKTFLEKVLGANYVDEMWESLPYYLRRGDLCHRCKLIFDTLLNVNNGDLTKLLMHIQVERFYFSRRYRKGLVTIEPQLHVDAQYHQLTYNKSIGSLPPSLQSLNLFTLTGDLVEGNRGAIEYSDLLKRPIDSFKYLLIACETGSVNVGSSIAFLDTLLLGSTNEVQLDAFKEFPDFTSFKARIELIRVPYLLSFTEEREIYTADMKQISHEKHVAPHTDWVLSLWAILTRLEKPNSINYPPNISAIVSNLSPLEKARLYDSGEMPISLTVDDKKLLKSNLRKIREEFSSTPYYEGRYGASAREIKSLLFSAAHNNEFHCLSPLAILREIEGFVKRVSEYEFLRHEIKEGFNDASEFIETVRSEYLKRVDREVRDCIGLYDSKQWEDFLKKYVKHVAFVLRKERVKNPITGQLEDPDIALIEEFEKIVEAPTDNQAKEKFRQNVISTVGAWSLDHKNEGVTYGRVFPEFWQKLEKHYYESQKALLTKMHNALLLYGSNNTDINEEGARLAYQTIENMKLKLGYCEYCAKEVVSFLLKQ